MFTGENLIVESIQVLLYGMLGIFIVMGIIVACTTLLNRFSKVDKD